MKVFHVVKPLLELPEAVFYKPPGWEVYGGHNQLQLVDAAQRLFGRRRLFEDVGHHHGFLYRGSGDPN